MHSFENKAGIFTVRYAAPEDMSPERQKALETALREASLARTIGIVFVVDPSVKMVDPSVPLYWLGVTGDHLIKLGAMAIVTTNAGVSIATRGFSVANTLKDRPLKVKPFPDEQTAQAWVAAVLAGAAA
jgi:hypothetical protein